MTKVEYSITINGLVYSNAFLIPEHLGLTQEEWDSLSNDRKEEVIIDDLNQWAEKHIEIRWLVV